VGDEWLARLGVCWHTPYRETIGGGEAVSWEGEAPREGKSEFERKDVREGWACEVSVMATLQNGKRLVDERERGGPTKLIR
jgi:hypothetical protein